MWVPDTDLGIDLTESSKTWLARQLYSLLLRLGLPFYLWRVWARGRVEPDYRRDWPQRLAWYGSAYRRALARPSADASTLAPLLWLHAVSLGEARAALPLVAALRAERPGMRLLLTHTTATGREGGQVLLQSGDIQTWLPYDTPGAVRRFLRLHQPVVGVLMETEVWPNVQHEARQAGIPMVLANARLSEKSLRQGRRFAALLQPAARTLALALAQTDNDARRLRCMGVSSVEVVGNVKFDMRPDPALLSRGHRWRQASGRPVVLAASTREGEEAGLLLAWRGALAAASSAGQGVVRPRLLIVPRHPQRFDEVAALVLGQGLSLSRRSAWPACGPDAQACAADVWLGDTMGEMPAYYAAAQVGLLGGSFAPLGGQNLIEAAACGCPIIMGPSTFNFEEAARLSEAAGAAHRVADWPAAVRRALQAAQHDADNPARAALALGFAQAHQGAAQRMARAIWGVVEPALGVAD